MGAPLLADVARSGDFELCSKPRAATLRIASDLRYTVAGLSMPSITAVIHTNNDALRLGRTLETLYPCDQIVVIDHGSRDSTVSVARKYGARVVAATGAPRSNTLFSIDSARWLLCLDPHESLTESLAASLFEWKTEHLPGSIPSFSVYLREETAEGWIENPNAQTRLVPANWAHWDKSFPHNDPNAVALEGELLRFVLP